MKFFRKDKKSDAAARLQEAEFDLALAARISEVVAERSHDEPEDVPPAMPLQTAGDKRSSHAVTSVGTPHVAAHAPAEAQARLPEAYAHEAGAGGWSTPVHAGDDLRETSPAAAPDRAPDRVPDPAPPARGGLPPTSLLGMTPAPGDAAYAAGGGAPPGLPDVSARMDWTSPAALGVFAGTAAPSLAPAPMPVPLPAPALNVRADAAGTPARLDAGQRPAPASSLTALTAPAALPTGAEAIDELMQQTAMRLRSLGTVNILVAGQTGVGKSTLINSVFGEKFAETAAGRPVTQHAQWFTSETVPLRILDTRGLEAKDYAVTLNDMRAEIEACRAQPDERDQLHMAWVCIASPSSRVQDCEVDIVRVLNKHEIPAIIVLTKDDDDEEFAGIVGGIMDERRASYVSIVPVRALTKPKRAAAGLEDLVIATFTALPLAHKAAFAASQKINRDMNKMAASEYVIAASSAAAAASVIPIPFADMATLAPIQASMLIGISNAFGLTLERSQIMQLITTVLGCLALSVAGGWAVGNLLKFIPGPGSAIGAVLNATVAGAMTQTLGKTYIRFIYTFMETNGRVPTTNEVFEIFPSFYKAGKDE